MILSVILGGVFWKKTNPFLPLDKQQKILNLIQLSLFIAIISFISSFIRISIFDLIGGLITILIIVNCPLIFYLIWKREEKFIHLIILISGLLIITFILYWTEMIIDPISQGHPIEKYTVLPPLSYPLMASYEEIFIHPPPGPDPQNIYYCNTFKVGIILPVLSIQLPYEFHLLSSDMIRNQTIIDSVILKNQFFYCLFYFLLNFITTLTTLKIYSKRDMEIEINKILNSASKIAILLANILFISLIITEILLYYIFRIFGDIILETERIFYIGIGMMISLGLILFFLKYPIFQEEFSYKIKYLMFLASFGLILSLSTWVIDIVSPHPAIHLVPFLPIIVVDVIIIILNLLILYKPLTLKHTINSDLHVLSNKKAL